jgi:hypothetical protein
MKLPPIIVREGIPSVSLIKKYSNPIRNKNTGHNQIRFILYLKSSLKFIKTTTNN